MIILLGVCELYVACLKEEIESEHGGMTILGLLVCLIMCNVIWY